MEYKIGEKIEITKTGIGNIILPNYVKKAKIQLFGAEGGRGGDATRSVRAYEYGKKGGSIKGYMIFNDNKEHKLDYYIGRSGKIGRDGWRKIINHQWEELSGINGGDGGRTTIAINGNLTATAKGGDGGAGAYSKDDRGHWYLDNYDYAPNSDKGSLMDESNSNFSILEDTEIISENNSGDGKILITILEINLSKYLIQNKNNLFEIENNVIIDLGQISATEDLYKNKGFDDVILIKNTFYKTKVFGQESSVDSGKMFEINIPSNAENIEEILIE